MNLVSQFQLSEILMHHFVALVGSFHQAFLQEAFAFLRRKIGIGADEIQQIIIVVDVFDGKISCIRNIRIQLNDF
jgi:hypothetical protein